MSKHIHFVDGDTINARMEMEMEQNKTETACARQLSSEHFCFQIIYFSLCMKSGESDNFELQLT